MELLGCPVVNVNWAKRQAKATEFDLDPKDVEDEFKEVMQRYLGSHGLHTGDNNLLEVSNSRLLDPQNLRPAVLLNECIEHHFSSHTVENKVMRWVAKTREKMASAVAALQISYKQIRCSLLDRFKICCGNIVIPGLLI